MATQLKPGLPAQKASQSTLAFREPEYHALIAESPSLFTSLLGAIKESGRAGHASMTSEYYGVATRLAVSDMRPWYCELPGQVRQLHELTPYWLLRLEDRVHLLPKAAEVPNIWRDFKLQPVSWLNSLLVHIVALTASPT